MAFGRRALRGTTFGRSGRRVGNAMAPKAIASGREPMHTQLLRTVSVAVLAALATVAAWSAGAAEAPKSIRIGYAISLSGVNAQGAAVTTLPGYDLWVKDVNDKGGIMVKEFGKRIPVEVAAKYDDTSSAENLLRLEEKLMSQDKVDFVLPPWSTGFNLATAPIFAKYGYPHLAVTANSNDEEKLVKISDAVLLPQSAAALRRRADRDSQQVQERGPAQQQGRAL